MTHINDHQPHVHLITGATGLGKTPAAIALARRTGAPIIVADRIQCFADLATTVARDGPVDSSRVERYFLSERGVAQGDYPLDQAIAALERKLAELTEPHPLVIIEGGSVSLLTGFAQRIPHLPHRIDVHLMRITDPQRYERILTGRVRSMLLHTTPGRGMFDELTHAWRHREQRQFLASILGFDSILKWSTQHNYDVTSLPQRSFPEEHIDDLVHAISTSHANYGYMQDRVFTEIFGKDTDSESDR